MKKMIKLIKKIDKLDSYSHFYFKIRRYEKSYNFSIARIKNKYSVEDISYGGARHNVKVPELLLFINEYTKKGR